MAKSVNLAVLLSGGGRTLQNIIDHIRAGKLDARVVVVISSREDAGGLARAKGAGIDAHCIPHKLYKGAAPGPFSQEINKVLSRYPVDLIVMAGFMHLFKAEKKYQGRVMNIHPALIPSFCGRGYYGHHVHQAVLDYGVKLSGCTVHFADDIYDGGAIILQAAVPVEDEDTADTLAARVFAEECKLYPRAIQLFAEGRLETKGRKVYIKPNRKFWGGEDMVISGVKGNIEGGDSSFFDELLSRYREEPGGEAGNLSPYIEKIRRKEDLEPHEAYGAMRILMSEGPSDSQRAAFLTALNGKGESIAEIAAFAFALREMALPVRVKLPEGRDAVIGDTCGTGGGTLNTFNISTTIMFVLAASGMVIAKHGNRAITSRCGSADVLEKLGVRIDLKPFEVEDCLSKIGIGFLYAPNFHKAFKNVQKVRKEMGVPTVFNILGPLANPAFDSKRKNGVQLLGVRQPRLTRKMAEVLKLLNMKRAFVVHGFDESRKKGIDELSTLGENVVSELGEDGEVRDFKILPEEFGFRRARAEDLTGGGEGENSGILIDILKGKERGAKRDIILLNAAAGLLLGPQVKSLKEGIEMAAQLIDSGQAYGKLEQLRRFQPLKTGVRDQGTA